MNIKIILLFFALVFCLPCSANDPHSLYLEAHRLLNSTEFIGAEKNIRKSLEIEPDFPDAWFLLSRIQFRLGKQREALQSYKKGVEKKRLNQEHINFLQEEVLTEDKTGPESVAFSALHRINEARKSYFQGRLEARRGAWYEAVVYFERATSFDPENLLYRNALGNALLDTGDYYSAEDVLKESLQRDPYQKDIYIRLIEAADEKKLFRNALHWALEGRKFFPPDPDFRDRELYYDYLSRQEGKRREH
jgi:tetratricopeptide (TPR) repeat protein